MRPANHALPTLRVIRHAAVLCLPLAIGCVGAIATGPEDADPAEPPASGPSAGGTRSTDHPGSTSGTPTGQAPMPAACVGGAGPAPVRRLTRLEYDNAVAALLGDKTAPARAFAADGLVDSFESNVSVPVTVAVAQDYMTAAETLAANANVTALVPCKPAPDTEDACARQFLTSFGKRAFRRPLSDSETTRYLALYAGARMRGHDFAGGIRLLLTALLQSPHFLDHIERGGAAAGSGVLALTPHELASRLSFFLWASPPDQALVDAADQGRLTTTADLEREARRLLADPRARAAVLNLYSQWLGLGRLTDLQKDTKLFPAFSAGVARSMRAETESFVNSVMWDGDAKLQTLLTAPFSFVNAGLAKIYGLPAVQGDTLQRTTLEPRQRGGILTQPSFMSIYAHTAQTAPVLRGKFVREQLLCQQTPSPPANVNTVPPQPDPKLTTRQRYEVALGDPFCGGCHRLMNPIGLAMENYDAIGQFRTSENGQAIDASGTITDSDVGAPFVGLLEMSQRLGQSRQVADCMTRQTFEFALGRQADASDACAIAQVSTALSASGGDLRELLVAVVESDGFRRRAAIGSEVCR